MHLRCLTITFIKPDQSCYLTILDLSLPSQHKTEEMQHIQKQSCYPALSMTQTFLASD